jgi:hypothetical protein
MARQIYDDTIKIGETGKTCWAVLVLESTAAALLARAHLEHSGRPRGGSGQLSQADWDDARTLPAVEAAWRKLSLAHGATLLSLTGAEREVALTRLSDEERKSFASALHDFVTDLLAPLEIEASRLGRALVARWSRVFVLVVVVGLGLALLNKWVNIKLNGPNLALHCPVTVSSQFPGQGTDHALLVDGDPDTLGFHTQDGAQQQWVVIDLGAILKFNTIVVYNRADGFEERAVPLKIEVSDDNQNYKQIAERKDKFDKWTVRKLNARGRYVRLENTPPLHFHLGEVEIYR